MKKLLSLAIGLLMILTLLPVGAAAGTYNVVIGNIGLNDGTYEQGQYILSGDTEARNVPENGSVPADYVAMYQDGTLTLNGFKMQFIGVSIFSQNDLTVILKGENTIGRADNPSITAIQCGGKLTIEGGGSLTAYITDHYGLWCIGDLDVKSGTITIIGSNAAYGIYSGGSVTISGGTITATSGAIDASGGDAGIYAGNDITVTGGTIDASGANLGISVAKDMTVSGGTIDASGGTGIYVGTNMTVSGGTINASDSDVGMYAANDMTITGGTIDANGDYAGMYAENNMTITGGMIDASGAAIGIVAKDIELGSRVTVQTGGTVRVISIYTSEVGGIFYKKTVAEGGLTKYYNNEGGSFSEMTEGFESLSFPDPAGEHLSTFSGSDELYFSIIEDSFVNASPEVVLRTRSASNRDNDDDDDEPVITGKITSYEELSRLSADYKAMKEYAETLGLGDFQVIGTWDVETKGYGPWEIIFHLDAKYLGDTLTIIHQKDDGTFETFTAVVDKSGEATISVTSASPFLVVRGEASGSTAVGGSASVTEENPDTGFDFGWRF